MDCTALSVANSNISVRRTDSGELVDVQQQIKIAEFLKHLLRSRLWLLKAKNEEQVSFTQTSLYSPENQSRLTELEYAQAVQDYQVQGLMKHLHRSKISNVTHTSDLLFKLLVKSSPNLNLREWTSFDIEGNFKAVRHRSLELQRVIDRTAETEKKRDEARLEICELQAEIKAAAKEVEESGKLDAKQADKYRRLERKTKQMRKMQTIITHLIGSFDFNDQEMFDECYKMLEEIGQPRSWNYYKRLVRKED